MTPGRPLGRLTGAALAVAVVAGGLAVQRTRFAHVRFDRFSLPAFDAYVYVAMGDAPDVFTLAPWGYRLLAPAAARALPGHSAGGFRLLTPLALVLGGGLLFLWLRRLGVRAWLALAAVAFFSLSPPVGVALRGRFLTEAPTLAVLVGWLLALEAGAPLGVLAAIGVVGSLSKEAFLLFVPAVLFVDRGRGRGRALASTLAVALPALGAIALLRLTWQPHLATSGGEGGGGLAIRRALEPRAVREWAPEFLLGGIGVAALAAVFTGAGRRFLRRYAYLLAVALALPVAAASYVSAGAPGHFFAADVPRLLLYATPLLLGLAAVGLERLLAGGPPPSAAAPPRKASLPAWALAVLLAVVPALAVDRYRRLDLSGPRDGPYVLAFCRETLRAARRLERGQTVELGRETHRFVWGASDPATLGRMRWFLWRGWGPRPQYGTGPIVMEGDRAELVLPLLVPREVEVELTTEGAAASFLDIDVNGRPVGRAVPGEGGYRARLPAAALVRGDNVVGVRAGEGGLVLARLRYRPR